MVDVAEGSSGLQLNASVARKRVAGRGLSSLLLAVHQM